MYNVYFEEDCVVLECDDCGELFEMTYEEFEEGVFNGEFEVFEFDEDEDDFCDCEDCLEDEEYDAIDETDDLLAMIAEEIEFALECGDYDGVKTLTEAYENLFYLIYE